MKLYVVVVGEEFSRGAGYNYRHIRSYESEKRAQNYAKKIDGARVVEFTSSVADTMTEKEAHDLLLELTKKFSIQSFIETHDSSYKAWPCPVCEKTRYTKEGWRGISYV